MSHVNVAMRVRPVSGDAGDYITLVEPGTMLISKPDADDMYQFNYTYAAQQITNEEIYEQVGRPVVDSVLDGYNGTVLAYGQTGSGKTFTMLGPPGKLGKMAADAKGIMPRALDQLFRALRVKPGLQGWKMAITYVEVYCEVIRDLLTAEKTARDDKKRVGVDVTEAKGVMHLKGLTPTPVASMKDVDALIEKAQDVRAQAATNMNDRSSRSHTILTIWLETTTADGTFHSKLNLVDLAGSERRKAVGEHGSQTNQEGDAINKSLLTLQNVVMALGQKGAVPSFRTSKLTHFLKDSIGGNCKTTLCACAWGEPSKIQETLATCRFAEKMMKVVVDAKKNKGGLNTVHGNKVKLDPTVLAIMEKRVADGIAAARAEFMAQHGGGGGGEGMSEEEKAELAELRARVLQLASAQPAADAAPGTVPSAMEAEMEKLRLQLQEAELKAEELEAQQLRAAAAADANRAEAEPAAALQPGLDDSVQAFIKLKELQPQQQELQARLEREGRLDEDDEEALEFLSDEIQRLMDVLREHGFNFPECDVGIFDAKPTDEGQLLDKQAVADELYQDSQSLDGMSEFTDSPQSSPAADPAAVGYPGKPPRGPASAGQLASGAGVGMRGDGRASFSRLDDRSSMQHMMSVPNDLVRPTKPGVLDRFKPGQKKSAALSDDNLNAHNQLQSHKGGAASEMVFMSPMDHDSVKAALQDHSRVDASLPLDLAKMPQMPKS